MSTLLGQKILYAFDDEHYGWYIGTIAGSGLKTRDLQQTPRANCIVSYKRKETMVVALDGKAACELSKHPYGVDQWWGLLNKKAQTLIVSLDGNSLACLRNAGSHSAESYCSGSTSCQVSHQDQQRRRPERPPLQSICLIVSCCLEEGLVLAGTSLGFGLLVLYVKILVKMLP